MRATYLLSAAFACFVVVLLVSTVGHAQDVLNLQLSPQNVDGYSFFTPIFTNFSGTAQCPAVGTPSFTYNFNFKVDPVNDDISFQGTTTPPATR